MLWSLAQVFTGEFLKWVLLSDSVPCGVPCHHRTYFLGPSMVLSLVCICNFSWFILNHLYYCILSCDWESYTLPFPLWNGWDEHSACSPAVELLVKKSCVHVEAICSIVELVWHNLWNSALTIVVIFPLNRLFITIWSLLHCNNSCRASTWTKTKLRHSLVHGQLRVKRQLRSSDRGFWPLRR